jgi:hypothetical protein
LAATVPVTGVPKPGGRRPFRWNWPDGAPAGPAWAAFAVPLPPLPELELPTPYAPTARATAAAPAAAYFRGLLMWLNMHPGSDAVLGLVREGAERFLRAQTQDSS